MRVPWSSSTVNVPVISAPGVSLVGTSSALCSTLAFIASTFFCSPAGSAAYSGLPFTSFQ